MNRPRSNDGKLVALSGKVYARLLACYPKGHREEYGPSMEQLFRDQCRAEWQQAGARGLVVLWLRVLADLLKTSTAEHFQNLKQRIFMMTKLRGALRNDPSLRVTFRVVFLVVFAISLGASVLLALFEANMYGSMARIEVERAGASGINSGKAPMGSYDPYLMQHQFELMNSDAILGRVAKKLKLAESWESNSGHGVKLSEADIIKLLRSRLELRPTRNTSFIEIRSRSRDPQEAANIAEALAVAYGEFHAEQIKYITGAVRNLPGQLSMSQAEQLKYSEDAATAMALSVVIVDHAEPDSRPVQPNRMRTLFLGSLGGILLAAFVAGAGVVLVHLGQRVSHPS